MSGRCTVGAGFIEWCDEPGIYEARWQNGDTGTLCVGHAAWVRRHSRDLLSISAVTQPNAEPAAQPNDPDSPQGDGLIARPGGDR